METASWFFKNSHTVAVIAIGHDGKELLYQFRNLLLPPVTIMSRYSNEKFYYSDVLVFMKQMKVNEVLNELKFLNPQQYCYLIIAWNEAEENSRYGYIHEIFQKLWVKRKILRVAFYNGYLGANNPDLVLFNPFVVSSKKLIYYSSGEEIRNGTSAASLFNFENLYGHPFLISMFHKPPVSCFIGNKSDGTEIYTGVDAQVIELMAKYINFSPKTVSPSDGTSFGYKEFDGTFTGALGDLLYNGALIAGNSRFIKDYMTNEIEFLSPPAYEDSLCVIVAKSKPSASYQTFLKFFPVKILIGMVTMCLLSSVVWFFIGKIGSVLNSNVPKGKTFAVSLIDMCLVMNTAPFYGLNTVIIRSQRIFIASCLLYSVVTMVAFQGILVTVLSISEQYDDINTLNDLDKSGMRIVTTYPDLNDTFSGLENRIMNRLRKKLDVLEGPLSTIVRRTVRRRDIGFLERLLVLEESVSKHAVVGQQLHVVKECPRHYLLAYTVRKRSLFVDRLNDILGRILQAGLPAKWLKDTQRDIGRSGESQLREKPPTPFSSDKPIEISDLALLFHALIVGHGLAIFAFVVEILLQHKSPKKKDFTLHELLENKIKYKYVYK